MPKFLIRFIAITMAICLPAETLTAASLHSAVHFLPVVFPPGVYAEQALQLTQPGFTEDPSDLCRKVSSKVNRMADLTLADLANPPGSDPEASGRSTLRRRAFLQGAGAWATLSALFHPAVAFGQAQNRPPDWHLMYEAVYPSLRTSSFHEAGTDEEKHVEKQTRIWLEKEKGNLPYEVFVFFGPILPGGDADATSIPITFTRELNGQSWRGIMLVWEQNVVRDLSGHSERVNHDLRHEKVHMQDLWAIEDEVPVRAAKILARIRPTIKDRDTFELKSYIYSRVRSALVAQNELKAIKAADPSWHTQPIPARQYRRYEDVLRYAVNDILGRIQTGLEKMERQELKLWLEQLLANPVAHSIPRSQETLRVTPPSPAVESGPTKRKGFTFWELTVPVSATALGVIHGLRLLMVHHDALAQAGHHTAHLFETTSGGPVIILANLFFVLMAGALFLSVRLSQGSPAPMQLSFDERAWQMAQAEEDFADVYRFMIENRLVQSAKFQSWLAQELRIPVNKLSNAEIRIQYETCGSGTAVARLFIRKVGRGAWKSAYALKMTPTEEDNSNLGLERIQELGEIHQRYKDKEIYQKHFAGTLFYQAFRWNRRMAPGLWDSLQARGSSSSEITFHIGPWIEGQTLDVVLPAIMKHHRTSPVAAGAALTNLMGRVVDVILETWKGLGGLTFELAGDDIMIQKKTKDVVFIDGGSGEDVTTPESLAEDIGILFKSARQVWAGLWPHLIPPSFSFTSLEQWLISLPAHDAVRARASLAEAA